MEILIAGEKTKNFATASASSMFCNTFGLVKKGHEECGDSLFVFCADDHAILGVFDGVSGEAGAASASSRAASLILSSLKAARSVNKKSIESAFREANDNIKFGITTATVCSITKEGSYIIVSVGDSPAYHFKKSGKPVLLNDLDRLVGEKDSIFKFFYYRSFLSLALGDKANQPNIHFASGKLLSGETLLLASDGLMDNLYISTEDGHVADASGCDDLGKLLKDAKTPKSMISTLEKEIEQRLKSGRCEKDDRLLVPKEDDLAMIALCFK